MAELSTSTMVPRPQQVLLPEEREIMEARRRDVLNYKPPTWTSREADAVSGEVMVVPKVSRTSIHSTQRAKHVTGVNLWG